MGINYLRILQTKGLKCLGNSGVIVECLRSHSFDHLIRMQNDLLVRNAK